MKIACCRLTVLVAFLFVLPPFAHADACSDAVDAAQKYIDSYDTIRTMEVDQLNRLVSAVCNADKSEQKSIFREEAERVESMVAGEKEKLDNLKDIANAKLAAAISDPKCTDKDKLSDLQKRVEEISQRIERISANGTHLGSNPAFDKLRKLGQMAHDDYYYHHSKCEDYRDIPVGDLKPDCILPGRPDEGGCIVIELKPDNSRAASDGWSNAKTSRDLLNDDADAFKKLDSQYPDKFSACKGKFKARVDCYHYCPDIDDKGEIKSTSLDWATCKD
jgi:hypothetical protein